MRARYLTALAVLMIGCAGGPTGNVGTPVAAATPGASDGGSASQSSGGFGPIEHSTGSTDVLLRFEQGGGFVAPAFQVTEAPIFTLYGDGRVIFRDPAADPLPAVGTVTPLRPFRTARLDEDQIQGVLEDALGRGGLGTARAQYLDIQIADAPTTTFTVNAGGIHKSVAVYALGIDVQDSADAPARAAFAALASRLQDFDKADRSRPTRSLPSAIEGS